MASRKVAAPSMLFSAKKSLTQTSWGAEGRCICGTATLCPGRGRAGSRGAGDTGQKETKFPFWDDLIKDQYWCWGERVPVLQSPWLWRGGLGDGWAFCGRPMP